MSPPPAHRATTAHLQALYPFVAEGGLGERGVYIGRDLFGGAFVYDAWELYGAGVLTNPNMVVLGQIGRGKSSFVKSLVWRQQVFGRQAWVVDPKGEYGPLAEATGAVSLRIVPGGSLRLNPLRPPGPARLPTGAGRGESLRRQGELLCSLAAGSLGRSLLPHERTAAELAMATVAAGCAEPTLPAVVDALLVPGADAARSVHTDVATLAADGRQVALELRRLVRGDLAGMFDGPTTEGIDLTSHLVVVDLSALYASPALGLLMTCATAWLQAALQNDDGIRRLIVIDEAWALLANLAIARWLQAGFKLARAFGAANVAVVHRLSDLRAAGAEGSEQQRLAEGLLADSETRVIFGQPPSEVDSATRPAGADVDRGRSPAPPAPRGGAVESRPASLPGRAPPGPPRVGAGRHRSPDELVHMRRSGGSDLVVLVLAVIGGALGLVVWLSGEIAAFLASGRWPGVSPAAMGSILVRLPCHPAEAGSRLAPGGPRPAATAPPAGSSPVSPSRWPPSSSSQWWPPCDCAPPSRQPAPMPARGRERSHAEVPAGRASSAPPVTQAPPGPPPHPGGTDRSGGPTGPVGATCAHSP